MCLCASRSKSVVDHNDGKKRSAPPFSVSIPDVITGTSSSSIVVANLRCTGSRESLEALLEHLNTNTILHRVQCVIAAPSLYLPIIQQKLTNRKYVVAAENATSSKESFTGEVSLSMLHDFGIKWVVLGHSERRINFHESNELIASKVVEALKLGFVVILCVGDTNKDRMHGKTMEAITTQLECIKDGIRAAAADAKLWGTKQGNEGNRKPEDVEAELWDEMVIVYEPVWANETRSEVTPEQVQEVHQAIRLWVSERMYDDAGENIKILYGGYVNRLNVAQVYEQPDVNGFMVEGGNLKEDFLSVVEATRKRKVKVHIGAPFSPQKNSTI